MIETSSKPSIVFMGTPEFAVEVLKMIFEEGFPIKAVITAPDRKAGRGKKIRMSAVKEYALENDLTILQPTNLKDLDFVNELKTLKTEIFIVVAFRMLPQVVWSIPPKGTFNLHASLLPQYRGAAPINWAIINGERQTGVSTFLIDEKIDTGLLLFQEEVVILPTDNVSDLHDKLMAKGAKLVIKTLHKLHKGDIKPFSQSIQEEILRNAPKIFKEDCIIDWTQNGYKIHNFIRGLSPYPGAFTYLVNPQGKRMLFKIFEASVQNKPPELIHEETNKFRISKSEIRIELKDAYIYPKIVQLEGKKRLSISDFLRGISDFIEWKIDFNKSDS